MQLKRERVDCSKLCCCAGGHIQKNSFWLDFLEPKGAAEYAPSPLPAEVRDKEATMDATTTWMDQQETRLNTGLRVGGGFLLGVLLGGLGLAILVVI